MKSYRFVLVFVLCVIGLAYLPSTGVFRSGAPERAGDPSRLPLSDARKSMAVWTAQRAYPFDDIPADGFMRAHRYARERLSDPADRAAKGPVWEPIGPHNIGGRTLALAFNPQNPQTIYAGSASGGLWRSHTAGVGAQAWHRVATGFPVLGVSSIDICARDSNIIYIGTGEMYSYDDTQGGITVRHTRGSYGMGVLKSADGGRNWAHSLDWSYDQGRAVHVVRLDPTTRDVVWAGTSHGTWKSTDAGATWRQVDATVMVTDLIIHPGDPNIVLIACGDLGSRGMGLYRTDDGGGTWKKIVEPGHIPYAYQGKAHLSVCRDHPDVMMASIGNGDLGAFETWLLRSEDAGLSWTRVSHEDYSRWQGWFSHDVAIHPQDPQTVYAAGIDIWKSTAGGAALEQISDSSGMGFGYIPIGGPEG